MDSREQAKPTGFEQLDGVCRSSYVSMVRLHLFGRYGFRCEGCYGAACWRARQQDGEGVVCSGGIPGEMRSIKTVFLGLIRQRERLMLKSIMEYSTESLKRRLGGLNRCCIGQKARVAQSRVKELVQ